MDSEDSDSDLSTTSLSLRLEHPPLANEILEDLTGEADAFLNDAASLSSLSLVDGPPVIKPRPYQEEMVQESLKRNIIVAMDTGSGKTHVAVMRMFHELERLPSEQLIWFLAPTVSLCQQQFEYIKSQISSVQVKFLSGADGVDRWTDQTLWDAVLHNVKTVVSTYQILLDALTHGFIGMEKLGLMVFDEAHNCVGNYAGARIMKSFYHPKKSQGLHVPHMLGLTASPVMQSDPNSVNKIEGTLDAICRTPTKHRAELLLQVKRPILSEVFYQSADSISELTKSIRSLGQAYGSLKIQEDPRVLWLQKEDTDKSRRSLKEIRLNHKTESTTQMKNFYATAIKVCRELGAWAADYYVSEVITRFLEEASEVENSLGGVWDLPTATKKYLAKALKEVRITGRTSDLPQAIPLISDKIRKLIDLLLAEPLNFRGIIFVQERAVVSVLAHLIASHPETRDRFRVGTIVGMSTHSNNSPDVAELLGVDPKTDALIDFRAGRLNLLIATNVLEEGIDVPSCNVVLCFQKPANLKSFIQRRGRARARDSKLVLLLESKESKTTPWKQLESDMKELYENDMRILRKLEVLEGSEQHDGRCFRVEKTGALLDLDNALPHLYHFCATLPAKEYVDLRPEFICTSVEGSRVRAKVILPLSVHEAVRTAESQTSWTSEKNAMKDAAFEAYMALYRAGLVNNHMLPLLRHGLDVDELLTTRVETRASLMVVNEQLNPWIHIAQIGKEKGHLVHYRMTVGTLAIEVYLPVDLPLVPPFQLYWDTNTELTVEAVPDPVFSKENCGKARDETLLLLEAAFGSRFPIEQKRHAILFSTLGDHLLGCRIGNHKEAENYTFEQNPSAIGLIRDKSQINVRYIYQASLPNKPQWQSVKLPYDGYENTPDSPHLSLKRLSRKADFFHKGSSDNKKPSSKPFSMVLPTSRCIVDEIPFGYVQFGLLIPSIMHRFEVYFVAEMLSESTLQKVEISDLGLIVTALTASSANEGTNYQRLEFLGDSILKLCTSIQLIAELPLWHEGYLSAKKDHLVANSRLSRAAMELGLDRFIISKQFTGLKWRPLYEEDLLEASTDGKRELSSKVLADVVEALIGAAMVDGGLPKALTCLQVFLPELQWKPFEARRAELFYRVPDIQLPETLKPLEILIGYNFNKKALLLEAFTHASCNSGSQSLERLEFLGDSLLDNIIVEAMYAVEPELSHFQMHLLRTALVNADFLAFICMDWSIEQEICSLQPTGSDDSDSDSTGFDEISTKVKFPLWRFMRHMSPEMGSVQAATLKRFAELQPDIKNAIETGSHYPWALLAKLQAQKFYSDIIESLLGAVWIDSGSLDTCTSIVARMGILSYFQRIVKEGVHVMHPKEELGVLADNLEVKYTLSLGGEDGGAKQYVCEVWVGDDRIVEYVGGVSKMEAQTKAAEIAVSILRAKKDAGLVGDKMELDIDNEIDGDAMEE